MADVTEPASLVNDTQQVGQRPRQLAQINRQIQSKAKSLMHLVYLLHLEEGEEALERDLIFFAIRILRRMNETAAYCEEFDNMIESFMHAETASCTIDDLTTMLKVIKLAKDQEQNDMQSWRRFYDERQSMLTSMGRSQKPPIIKKKKSNHNRNKNKNRSKKKKEKKLHQDESMESEADLNEVAEGNDEGSPELQGSFGGALPDNTGDQLFGMVYRAISMLGTAPETKNAQARGRSPL